MQRIHRLERSQLIERPIAEVFAFFADAANLERITPPFLSFRMLTRPPIEMHVGARIDYRISLLGIPLKWRTCITTWQPGVCFVDEQESGPYALWRHRHRFEERGNATLMTDVVEYREPLGPLGLVAHTLFVARTLYRIFDYRENATRRLFQRPSREASFVTRVSTT
jgi:ligand-binding SRPBCC domain-containing protein